MKKNIIGSIFKKIVNNKYHLLVIFLLNIFCLYKVYNYQEELRSYRQEFNTDEIMHIKKDTTTNSYYNKEIKDITPKKGIAISNYVSCLQNKIDINDLPDNIKNNINELNDYFNSKSIYYSFLYKDIYTGFTVSYNPDDPIFTASTIKAPAMIYLYEQASAGKIDLQEELTYTSKYHSDGSGILKTKDFDTKYTIETLVHYTIYYSDNAAYRMLMDKIDRKGLQKFWKDKGVKYIFTTNDIWGNLTANDANIFMQELYDFYLKDDKYGTKLMDEFTNCMWKMLTDKNGEYNTANKIGYSGYNYHDIAIVLDKNPYILAVLSNTGENEEEAEVFFKKVSVLVGTLHEDYWKYKLNKCDELK